ncbi:hypothetical protein AWB70_03119 [Caballeronia cordobensis]|uniref:Uncharacterized protein n=2 Tax=Caballeronia cordobensis TaxID=1353886 RepID=A0A158HBC0_CABCO|nr:hypothetical protein AWB70_03119 [Caballeronia cordobensis]
MGDISASCVTKRLRSLFSSWSLYSCRSIGAAPPRGGGNFLCCCKESHQRKQLCHRPRSHAVWPLFSSGNGPRLKSALINPIELGSRTVRHIAPLNEPVQPFQVPARFAADGSIGYAWVSPAYPTAARSAVPKLFRAEPVRFAHWLVRPCAIQARSGLWGHSLGEDHSPRRKMANVRVTAGGEKAAFFGDFLCSSKESYPRPGEGQC